MEKLNFKLEFADNGVIVTDDSSGFVNVYEEKENKTKKIAIYGKT